MPRRVIDLRGGHRPILDIASYARRAADAPLRINRADLETIRRTINRVPEVMIKISGGGVNVRQVSEHLRYIQRNGKLELQNEDGEKLRGKGVRRQLVDDWGLDLDAVRAPGRKTGRFRTPRLVHNIVFSMPPGTPPKKLLAAVSEFADIEWGGRHRYAMVLHTDTPHPHVHVVVKAVSELGDRLNPSPEILREWRSMFAQELRTQGVPANATERAVRGAVSRAKSGEYRLFERCDGIRYGYKAIGMLKSIDDQERQRESGRNALGKTRKLVVDGWLAVASVLEERGSAHDADVTRSFVRDLPQVQTRREFLMRESQRTKIVVRDRTQSSP